MGLCPTFNREMSSQCPSMPATLGWWSGAKRTGRSGPKQPNGSPTGPRSRWTLPGNRGSDDVLDLTADDTPGRREIWVTHVFIEMNNGAASHRTLGAVARPKPGG